MEGKIRTLDVKQPYQVVQCDSCGEIVIMPVGEILGHKCKR